MSDNYEEGVEETSGDGGQEPSKVRRHKPMRHSEWISLKNLWERGDHTLKELGEMYDRQPSYLSQKFKREGVERGARKDEVERKAQKELEKDMSKNVGLKIKRANETKEENYEWSKKIQQLTIQTIANQVHKKQPLGDIKNDLLSLKVGMEIIGKGHDIRNVVLGLDKQDIVDEEQLPEFGVFEMTEGERQEVVDKAEALLKVNKDADFDIPDEMPSPNVKKTNEDAEYIIRRNMQKLANKIEDGELPETRIAGHDG